MRIEEVKEHEGGFVGVLVELTDGGGDGFVGGADLVVEGGHVVEYVEAAIKVEPGAHESRVGKSQRGKALVFEDVGSGGQFVTNGREHNAFAEGAVDGRPSAGENRGDRRQRPPGRGDGLSESNAVSGDRVDVRGGGTRVAIATEGILTKRVDDDQDHVVLGTGRTSNGDPNAHCAETEDQANHEQLDHRGAAGRRPHADNNTPVAGSGACRPRATPTPTDQLAGATRSFCATGRVLDKPDSVHRPPIREAKADWPGSCRSERPRTHPWPRA